jgi:hypothetical protein
VAAVDPPLSQTADVTRRLWADDKLLLSPSSDIQFAIIAVAARAVWTAVAGRRWSLVTLLLAATYNERFGCG